MKNKAIVFKDDAVPDFLIAELHIGIHLSGFYRGFTAAACQQGYHQHYRSKNQNYSFQALYPPLSVAKLNIQGFKPSKKLL